MKSSRSATARVVSTVSRDGEHLVLVDDMWTTDSDDSPPENRRAWTSVSGTETRTMTTSSGCTQSLAARVTDVLSGAAMERLILYAAPRETMVAAVQRAQAAEIQDDATCLTVDGEPRGGWVAESDGVTARGVVVGDTVIVTISDGDSVSVTLGPPDLHTERPRP